MSYRRAALPFVLLLAATAHAQSPSPSPSPSLSASLSPSPPPSSPDLSGAPGSGLTAKFDRFSLNLRSRLQLKYALVATSKDASGQRDYQQLVNVNTLRLWISGHVLRPELTYMIQLALAGRDYRDGATSPVFDAFLDYKANQHVAIRVGQFFVPFDRLRTVREFALQLTERPRPVAEFSLDRDAGVLLYSESFLGTPFTWRLGAFGGHGTNTLVPHKAGGLLLARLELRPLGDIDDDSEGDLERRHRPGLAIGAGVAANFNTSRLRSATGTTFTGGNADYYHAAGDLVFKWAGLALELEYLYRRAADDQILSTDTTGAPVTEFTRSGHGWVTQASYYLPVRVEVVGRLSRIYAFDGTDPALIAEADRKGQELSVGANYYANGHRFKFQAAWIARMPGDFAFDSAEHAVQAQLDATF